MTLDQLKNGQTGRVTALNLEAGASVRLMEMGLLEGCEVRVLGRAPLGDPMELQIGDYRLSLRQADAAGIEVDL